MRLCRNVSCKILQVKETENQERNVTEKKIVLSRGRVIREEIDEICYLKKKHNLPALKIFLGDKIDCLN